MSQRFLTYMRLGDITPAEVNPKLHDLPSLIASLDRFGWTNPALMDERTGRLCAGHGRREAAISIKQSGEAMPDGVILDEDGEWMIPVTRGWASRTDHEAMAYIIADNQLTIAGEWHMQTYAAQLEEIITHDASVIDALGVSYEDVEDIIRRIDPETLNPGPSDWRDEGDFKHGETTSHTPGDTPLGLKDDTAVKPPPTITCPACGFGVPI